MRHGHPSILVLLITALLVGVSISAGPVAWVVLVMVSPLIIMMMLTARGVTHGSGHPVAHAPGHSPEAIRAAMLHDRERVARAGADEYTQAHLND